MWTLTLFAAAACLFCVLGLVVGGPPPAGVATQSATAVCAAAIAIGLWSAPPRARSWAVQASLITAVGAITVLASRAGTGEGAVSIALGFTWLAVHAALFCPRHVARAHTAAGVAGCGLALGLSVGGASGFLAWTLLSTTSVIAAETLAGLFRRVRALSLTDELTGLLNRTGFAAAVERERASARRTGEPIVLVVVDLDGFKAVNDERGHDAGDRLLVALADGWRAHLRPRDLVGRLGGDEFALVLPATSHRQAQRLLARLHEDAPVPFSSGTVVLTALEPLDEALHRADRRMYADKQARRGAAPSRLGLEPLESPRAGDPGPAEAVVQPRRPPLPEFDRLRP